LAEDAKSVASLPKENEFDIEGEKISLLIKKI
jgi:hypothetical protein